MGIKGRLQPLQGWSRPGASPDILAVEAWAADRDDARDHAIENIAGEAISAWLLACGPSESEHHGILRASLL
jgi:hypothetical protein